MFVRKFLKGAPIIVGAFFLSCSGPPEFTVGHSTWHSCLRHSDGVHSLDADCLVSSGFIGRLKLLDEEDNPSYCTAFLVAPQKAITAAHCLSEYVFRAIFETSGKEIKVSNIQRHPDYKYARGGSRLDFALVTLAEGVGQLTANFAETPPVAGDRVYFIGYGATLPGTSSGGALHSGHLQVIAVKNDHILAVAPKGQHFSTCVGDSGGPAITVRNGRPEVIGLISSGSKRDCGIGDVSVLMRFSRSDLPTGWWDAQSR